MRNDEVLAAYLQAGTKKTSARTKRLVIDNMADQRSRDKFVAAVFETMRGLKDELKLREGTYEMANVRPDRSGLPFIVYISEKGNSKHAARVKVATAARATEFNASVSIEPDVEVKAGELASSDLELLKQWITLNKDTLLGYWNGDIMYTEDALSALKPVVSVTK